MQKHKIAVQIFQEKGGIYFLIKPSLILRLRIFLLRFLIKLLAILTVGTLFVGYKLITDPGYITDWISPRDNPPDADITLFDARTGSDVPTPSPSVSPQATGVVTEAAKAFTETTTNVARKVVSALNPLNYYTTQGDKARKFAEYMESQKHLQTQKPNLYPFTEVNPFDSWFNRLKLLCFGESKDAYNSRQGFIIEANREYDSFVRVRQDAFQPFAADSVANVGLGMPNFLADVNVGSKLNSVFPTPAHTPKVTLVDLPLQPESTEWAKLDKPNYSIASSSKTTLERLSEQLTDKQIGKLPEVNITYAEAVNKTVSDLATPNRFEVLNKK